MYRPIVAPDPEASDRREDPPREDPRDGLIVEGVCRQSQPYNRPDGRHRGRHGYTENVGDEDAKSDEKEDGDASRERNFNRDDPSVSVFITFRPTVHPPRKTKNVMIPAAVAFLIKPAPTAGPHAIPVDEPPMLKPTKIEATTPTTRTVSTIYRVYRCVRQIIILPLGLLLSLQEFLGHDTHFYIVMIQITDLFVPNRLDSFCPME